MTTLKTRPPTGRAPWPLILIEGGEKAGKSWSIAELSASPKVGQTYWIDLGEGSADEYGAVPGARYLVVEHDGTFGAILRAVAEIRAEAAQAAEAKQPPVVLGIDSMTAEWELLKGQADAKARARLAKKGKAVADDAEPQISVDLWNEINSKHRRLMTMLMTFPGIVIMTARGKEVAALDNAGRPVEGSREYRVEGQKGLAYDASVWLRVSRDHAPMVVGARSVHAGVRPGVDRPRPVPGLTLETVIFDVLRCNPAEAEVRALVEPKTVEPDESTAPEETDEDRRQRANKLRDWAVRPERTGDELRDALARLKAGYPETAELPVVNEHGDEEELSTLLQRRIHDTTDAAATPAMVTDEQHRHMHALWRELGYDGEHNRGTRLQVINRVIGRKPDNALTTSKDLTHAEADQVIAALKERRAAMKRQPEGASA